MATVSPRLLKAMGSLSVQLLSHFNLQVTLSQVHLLITCINSCMGEVLFLF